MVEARRIGRGHAWRLSLDDEASVVEVRHLRDGGIRAVLDERVLEGGFAVDGRNVMISLGSSSHVLEKPGPPDVDRAGDRSSLTAPMPGTVVKVLIDEGDEVEEGRTLLVLEAMKMEQSVAAPHVGAVRSLPFGEGDLVPGGAVLTEIE